MANLFDRLTQRRAPTTETAIQQQRRKTRAIARGIQETSTRTFLTDALANGPVPAAIIRELGTARGLNGRQLWHAKQQIGAGSFKRKGKFNGCWFWTLTEGRAIAIKSDDRHTRRLRDLSRILGYRLRPIGKYPR
jgi:hypothetical protein